VAPSEVKGRVSWWKLLASFTRPRCALGVPHEISQVPQEIGQVPHGIGQVPHGIAMVSGPFKIVMEAAGR